MSYVLYSSKGSGAFAVEAALAKAGARYETVPVDTANGDQNDPKFVAINPMRQVPALKLPDGSVMTESAAMVIHIANVHPDKGLAPTIGSSGHAAYLRWMVFMAANIYEADLRYFYAERYTQDPKGVEGVKAAGAAYMAKCFGVVEEALANGPFLCGKTMTIADAYLAMLGTWSPEPLKLPRIGKIVAAVAADSAYGPVWARHGMSG